MKKCVAVCLMICFLILSSQTIFAAELQKTTEEAENPQEIDNNETSEEKIPQEADEIPTDNEEKTGTISTTSEDVDSSYVIQGFGEGITPNAEISQKDEFSELVSDFVCDDINEEQKKLIINYYENNGGESVFGSPLNNGYSLDNGTGYIDYEYASIFSSKYGVFAVKTWLLNVYISSGGVNTIGAPVGEEYVEDGFLWQEFEKGTLSYEREEVNDTLCVRRGNTYYFKCEIDGGEADYIVVYGKSSDIAHVGDWDGDGVDTLCVRRGNLYYFQNDFRGGEADYTVVYGKADDSTYVGDWDGDGVDTLCVRRGNLYYFQNDFRGGEADYIVVYGKKTDDVCVGTWEKKVKRLDQCDGSQMLFNMSRGYSYSQLSYAFAGNSVNSTSFRKSAITTHINANNDEIQYCAYYDYFGTVVLGRRVNSGEWTYQWTKLKGTITDAHNVVSIAVDGQGYLHVALSSHSGGLTYGKSVEPDSLMIEERIMLGELEDKVTYPEFYVLPSGNLFFLYRNGTSGNGNLVLNKYNVASEEWMRVNNNLISGEGLRSPYWQATVDGKGRLHISWVWRETGDVSTNYNLSYMVSTDDSGTVFTNSKGEILEAPVTEETAEVIQEIPQNSSLINQTSMTVDDDNFPYIISYWREKDVVQYHVIRFTGEQWIVYNTDIRNTDFDLSGVGTRQLPCARPQILVNGSGENAKIYTLFRDKERASYASIAMLSINGTEIITENIVDITNSSLGEWEPNYDIELWRQKRKISIFLQKEYFTSDGSNERYQLERIYVIDIPLEVN